ncbi:MAG: ABC transporter ATP-binding protein, partial [Pseudomonadota bacterium]
NHLDMESCEGLIEALTAYTGAVVLVSHDMHLLSHVADRLWLVQGGRVAPYEGDLEAYRRFLLDTPTPKPAKVKPQKPKPSRATLTELRQAASTAEARVEKLMAVREKLAQKLADPAMYDAENIAEAETWQKKFAEVEDGLARAEALWITARERLDAADI